MVEGLDTLEKINLAYVGDNNRPIQNIRIKHTMVIDDGPHADEQDIAQFIPSRSPSPNRKNPEDGQTDNYDVSDG